MNRFGWSGAWSARTTTSRPVTGCRFFRRMEITSMPVHPASPISSSSLGRTALSTPPLAAVVSITTA